MPRHVKFALIILGVGFAVALGFFVDIVGRVRSLVNEKETEENPFKAPAKPLFKPADPAIPVKLFFPDDARALLSTETQTIFQSDELVNRARQILEKLAEGPKNGALSPSIPKDARVVEVYFREGIAYVDYSAALTTNHPGGIFNEEATIYSIVDSLTYNLSEIHQVKILIGGAESETLAGHCLLRRPFGMDLAMTDIAPPEPKLKTEEESAPEGAAVKQ
ncbi:MAG TPA: GerMN domain-containing protein [Terriglobia bacterium]|nr:GerMN domain-containing protein [Terriglobia bacterium]